MEPAAGRSGKFYAKGKGAPWRPFSVGGCCLAAVRTCTCQYLYLKVSMNSDGGSGVRMLVKPGT